MRRWTLIPLLALAVTACEDTEASRATADGTTQDSTEGDTAGGTDTAAGDDTTDGDSSATPDDDAAQTTGCTLQAESTLNDVAIELTGPCTMKQGTSATFSYDVKVAADVEALVPEAQDAGHCDEPGPSGLKVFYRITGDSCSFCICDEGLCDGTPPAPMTLQAGTYSESFDWDGLAWTGPSDFGNPKGEACPPGTYEVEVTAKGTAGGTPYTVTATRQLLITD